MVGRDGVVNGTSALDGKMSLHKGIVQVAGSAAMINPDVLRNIAHEFDPLQSIMIRHEQVLLAQAQQSAGCNASHTVESRMCRWLLRMRDLAQSRGYQSVVQPRAISFPGASFPSGLAPLHNYSRHRPSTTMSP